MTGHRLVSMLREHAVEWAVDHVSNGGRIAAPRDASWWDHPSTTRGGKYHVLDGDTCRPLCGVRMLPILEHVDSVERVERSLRCQRNGCRQAWPAEGGS